MTWDMVISYDHKHGCVSRKTCSNDFGQDALALKSLLQKLSIRMFSSGLIPVVLSKRTTRRIEVLFLFIKDSAIQTFPKKRVEGKASRRSPGSSHINSIQACLRKQQSRAGGNRTAYFEAKA
jgi:hypothetical protein